MILCNTSSAASDSIAVYTFLLYSTVEQSCVHWGFPVLQRTSFTHDVTYRLSLHPGRVRVRRETMCLTFQHIHTFNPQGLYNHTNQGCCTALGTPGCQMVLYNKSECHQLQCPLLQSLSIVIVLTQAHVCIESEGCWHVSQNASYVYHSLQGTM